MRQKKTQQLLNYWLDLFAEAGNSGAIQSPLVWPERSAIQPAHCRSLLGNMFILERVGADVTYRLAGTTLCSLYGRELKSEGFADVFGGVDHQSAQRWAARPGLDDYCVLLCSTGETDDAKRINLETLLLPLSHHGKRGTRILGITSPTESPVWAGASPIITQSIRSVRVSRPWKDLASHTLDDIQPEKSPHAQSRRTELQVPGLFAANNPPDTDLEPMASPDEPRKVAHLTIIDGGKT